jgi:hypothetical protein
MSRAGETIAGKYRVIAPIGVGGMGAVYAARHLQLDTPLALKFLTSEATGSVERFLREAKACAALRSEHVCRVTDYGIDGDTPYIAMELLEGEDLAGVLRGGKVPVATAVDYVIQACLGIAEAHALGIVHRDLKPGNLFLTRRTDGSPLIKVVDFGIAKVDVVGDVVLTQTSSIIGSPAYMSPEQVRSSRSVDARSDVWSLAVILYELISDRYPFKGASLTDLAVAIATEPHLPLGEAPELDAVIARALQKDPARRHGDVAAFVAALQPFCAKHRDAAEVCARILYGDADRPTVPREAVRVAPEAVTTLQRSTGETTPRPRPKRQLGVSLAIATGLLGGGGVAYVVMREPAPAPPPVAQPAPIVLKAVPEAPKTGRVIVTVSGTDAAEIWIDGQPRGRGLRIAEELSLGAHEIELRVVGRAAIRQPVDVQAGMVNSVAIVVPTAPTATPTVTLVAKAAPAKRPKVVAPKEPAPEEPAPTPAPPERVIASAPPAPALLPCAVFDRLPSGECAAASKEMPERLFAADFLVEMRRIWPSVLACNQTDGNVRVELQLAVGADGSVNVAKVRSAEDAGIGACAAKVIQAAKFRQTRMGGSLRYPMTL